MLTVSNHDFLPSVNSDNVEGVSELLEDLQSDFQLSLTVVLHLTLRLIDIVSSFFSSSLTVMIGSSNWNLL